MHDLCAWKDFEALRCGAFWMKPSGGLAASTVFWGQKGAVVCESQVGSSSFEERENGHLLAGPLCCVRGATTLLSWQADRAMASPLESA